MTDSNLNILIVEDSRFFQKAVRARLENSFNANVFTAETLAEARAIISEKKNKLDFALTDLILPDSTEGEALEYALKYNIPCIVFSSVYSEDLRNRINSKPIVDYLVKDSPSCMESLSNLLDELTTNMTIKALVVDDSKTCRTRMASLLRRRLFQVKEATNADDACKILEDDPEIRLLITDYHMPGLNGADMVKKIRQTHDAHKLAIIGLSSSATSELSAKFVKYGANDFLSKDFCEEEFFCRVQQNIRMISLMDRLKTSAVTDFLTGINNRAYFFEAGNQLVASKNRGQIHLSVAMLDLDHFKRVNDGYGHDAGDKVLKAVSSILKETARKTDIVARLGGEEFGVILVNDKAADCAPFFERLRQKIENCIVDIGEHEIKVTCSIGVTKKNAQTLERLVSIADEALYVAKDSGRNQVVYIND